MSITELSKSSLQKHKGHDKQTMESYLEQLLAMRRLVEREHRSPASVFSLTLWKECLESFLATCYMMLWTSWAEVVGEGKIDGIDPIPLCPVFRFKWGKKWRRENFKPIYFKFSNWKKILQQVLLHNLYIYYRRPTHQVLKQSGRWWDGAEYDALHLPAMYEGSMARLVKWSRFCSGKKM